MKVPPAKGKKKRLLQVTKIQGQQYTLKFSFFSFLLQKDSKLKKFFLKNTIVGYAEGMMSSIKKNCKHIKMGPDKFDRINITICSKDSLFSEYLDLEIATIFLLLVQDHGPSLLNKYFPKHKEQVPQYTDLHD